MRNVLACTPIGKAVRSEAYAILDWRAKRRSGISPSVRASIEEKASVGGGTTTPVYPQENTKVQTTRNVFNQSFYFSFSFPFIKKILFVTLKTSRDYINMSYMILILFLILSLSFSFFFFSRRNRKICYKCKLLVIIQDLFLLICSLKIDEFYMLSY